MTKKIRIRLKKPTFRIDSFNDFIKYAGEVPDDLIDGIMAGEGNALDHGQYRSGKFWWVALKMLALALGMSLLGRYVVGKRCRVIYFGEEDSAARVKERLLGLCAGLEIKPEELDGWLYICSRQGLSFDVEEHREWIRRQLRKLKPRLIIIDPLRSVTSTGDSGGSEIHDFFRFIRELQNQSLRWHREPLTVELVHHDRKNDKLIDSRASSGVIADKCEVIHQLTQISAKKLPADEPHQRTLVLEFGVTFQDYKFDIPDEPSPHSKYHFAVRIHSLQQQVVSLRNHRTRSVRWHTIRSIPSWVSPDALAETSTKGLDLSKVLSACTKEFQRIGVLAKATGLLPPKKPKRHYEAVRKAIRNELVRLDLHGLVEHNGKKLGYSAFRRQPFTPTAKSGTPSKSPKPSIPRSIPPSKEGGNGGMTGMREAG